MKPDAIIMVAALAAGLAAVLLVDGSLIVSILVGAGVAAAVAVVGTLITRQAPKR